MTIRKYEQFTQNSVNRRLRALSNCNQALLRAEDEQTLLDDICRIICEEAGYYMAWVGYAEKDVARSVSPRSWAGAEQGYLSQGLLTWADTPAGHRPLGYAIRNGETTYAQDLNNECESLVWINQAISRGLRSAIALPLKNHVATTFGALCIYSEHKQAFTPDEIELLEELAANLAFGITSLRLREKAKDTEQRLIASEQLFRTLVEHSPNFIARYDLQQRRIYINPTLRKQFSIAPDQAIGMTPADQSPLLDPDRYMNNIRRVIETGNEYSDDLAYRPPDGSIHWASMRFAPEFDSAGKVETVLVIAQDITKHIQAEEERLAHLHFLQCLDRINQVLQEEGNINQIMQKVVDEVLEIFDCDRVFLLYPCDPDMPTWSVPIESTRSEYPVVFQPSQVIPMDEHVASILRLVLDSGNSVKLGAETGHPVPDYLREKFSIRSFMTMALYPRVDKPWQFGIHQCSYDRVWTKQETRLFEEIGHRLSEGLNSLLITRDLRKSEERFRLVFENSPLPIREEDYSAVKTRLDELRTDIGDNIDGYLTDHPELVEECAGRVRIIDINRAALVFHATDSKETVLRELPQIFVPETLEAMRHILVSLMLGETELRLETILQTLTGRRQYVSIYLAVCSGYEQSLGRILVSLIDITERKLTEDQLRLSASVFANSQEGILISDSNNRIIDVNPAFTRLTGYSRKETLGENPSFLSAGRQKPGFYADMWQSINTRGEWQGELWNRRKSGEVYAELLSIVAVKDDQGRLQHYVGSFYDISIIKQHEADLDRIAHYDMLTSVPNRRLLQNRLEQAIAHARRFGKSLAICYLDLDGFKPINDQFGHECGDHLLVEVAKRLESLSRADDTVGRLGGDEFVLLWNDIDDEAHCVQALERVLLKVSEPMLLHGVSVSVSGSIGVTIYPEDNVDADNLLRHADHAMYTAKQLGKNRYQIFDARLERQISARSDLLTKVAQGLDQGQFELFYQPKVDCVTGEVQGVEALIRWSDPVLGLVGAKEFLSLIENESLAFRVGRWMMEQAVRQARTWNDMGITLPISINVFPRHLKYKTFIDDLRQAIETNWPQMPEKRLTIEIIESSDLVELEPIEQVIKECRKMGVGFSLDDFGSGHSSLEYLRRLSIEELKIDRSFVRDMLKDPTAHAVVAGAIGLGRAFGLRMIAEGVESIEQARHLANLGCTILQGYGLGRPMPTDTFQVWYADIVDSGLKI